MPQRDVDREIELLHGGSCVANLRRQQGTARRHVQQRFRQFLDPRWTALGLALVRRMETAREMAADFEGRWVSADDGVGLGFASELVPAAEPVTVTGGQFYLAHPARDDPFRQVYAPAPRALPQSIAERSDAQTHSAAQRTQQHRAAQRPGP